MNGSTRLASNSATSVRAPYSAPQTPSRVSASRNFDPETGAPLRLLTPFVPREFRGSGRADVTAMPLAEQVTEVQSLAAGPLESTAPIALLFSDDPAPTPDFAAFIEAHDEEFEHGLDDSDSSSSQELPWIDAFAADIPPEPEESWPLGEAGKRLDELTQSLSSLDASREQRLQAERESLEAVGMDAADTSHSMWNEEEWMDIMPTAPADQVPSAESPTAGAADPVADSEFASSSESPVNAEAAARALEELAQRVRAGDLPLPAFSAQVGKEAMLAGVLASMLGWRQ